MSKKTKSKFRPYKRVLKEDYDFDFASMLPILEVKLKKLAKQFEEDKLVEGWQKMVQEINLAVKLINIINGNDPTYEYLDKSLPVLEREKRGVKILKYVNGRNFYRFFTVYKSDADLYTDKFKKQQEYYYFFDTLREDKAWSLLWKLISYRARTWWD